MTGAMTPRDRERLKGVRTMARQKELRWKEYPP
jgi:hypothetical protein